jgi:hypothetical protein
MIYTFKVPGAFGKVHCEELRMDNPRQIEDIKEFMLAIAPQIVQSSLGTDRDPKTNAEITMRWAMHLAVTYETFRIIAETNITQAGKQGQGYSAPGVFPIET